MTLQQRHRNAFIISLWIQVIFTCMAHSTYPASPGSPLSEEEYEQFIKLIQPEEKAKQLCDIRRVSGCEDPQVFVFDLFENHGQIPKGPVCTELDTFLRFDSFCHFAMFRCRKNQFYIKRIPCSDQLFYLDNFSEEMTTPPAPVFPHASRIKKQRTLHVKTDAEQLSSHLRSLTDKLLVFSFTVCNQQPIRRNQQNLPKSIGGPRDPSRTKGRLSQTEQDQNNLKEDFDQIMFKPELENAAIHDDDEEVSDYNKGEETDSAGSDFKPKKKYKAAVSFNMKGQNAKITAVSFHHQEREDTVESSTVPDYGYPSNISSRERNQVKTRGRSTSSLRVKQMYKQKIG